MRDKISYAGTQAKSGGGGVTARFYGNSPPHMQPHKPHLELYIYS